MFFPHVEVLKNELSIADTLMSQNAIISTKALAACLVIQIHTLEAARSNWIVVTTTIEQLNKRFLDKYSLSIPT